MQAVLKPIPHLGVVDHLLQPVRVTLEPVLLVRFTRDGITRTFIGDSEGEDGVGKDEDDEEGHGKEVEP